MVFWTVVGVAIVLWVFYLGLQYDMKQEMNEKIKEKTKLSREIAKKHMNHSAYLDLLCHNQGKEIKRLSEENRMLKDKIVIIVEGKNNNGKKIKSI